MAKSTWSKEDFDNTFEEFLKTSFSSEDDTEKIKQLLKSPSKSSSKNSASLWWDKNAPDDSPRKGKNKSFLKVKNSAKSSSKPKLPLESNTKSSIKGNKTSLQNKHIILPIESKGRDMQKSKWQTSAGKTRGVKSKTETSISKDSLEDISEKSEEHDIRDCDHSKRSTLYPTSNSNIDTSQSYDGAESSRNKENLGFDTLDELVDKEHFFQNLENEHDGAVDYGRLNQELSQTGGTKADNSLLSGPAEDTGTLARNLNSDLMDSTPQKPSMLSRVALLDSVESTMNTTPSPKVVNSRETTQDTLGLTQPESLRNATLSGLMGTNTSKEMEDLQKVLQEAEETPTIYGGDSRPATAKISQQTTVEEEIAKEVNRSVGDILKEMDAIYQRGQEIESRNENIQLRSNYGTPRSPYSQGLNQKYSKEDVEGFDHSHTEDTEEYQPITAVLVKEKRMIENRPDSRERAPSSQSDRSRGRFVHVRSSGYGQSLSPQARKSSQSKPTGKSSPRVSHLKSSPDVERREVSRKNVEKQNSDVWRKASKNLSHNQQGKDNFDQMKAEWAKRSEQDRDALLLEQLKELMEQLNSERTLKAKLQEELVSQEQEFMKQLQSQKEKYEEEVFSLKQENFVLSAKLKEMDADKRSRVKKSDHVAVSGSSDDAEDSLVAKLKQEIQEQENLLAGYQAENKRLYEEIKSIQRQVKAAETSMFKENQRLTVELTNIKQELELKNTELQNKGIITSMAVQQQIAAGNTEAIIGANRIAHLEGELAEAKRVQENLSRELRLMQQNKFELEQHIETLVTEKDSLARQVADSLKPEQVKELEARHKEEMDQLQKKIRWYAENQELLDKSSAKLRAKDDEIHRLKMRLEDLKSEAGMKLEEDKIRAKEKAASAKKIQDLERQVKEMEQVIRRRHPNSLPAMMMVAASIPDSTTDSSSKSRITQVLEARVKKLEKELESKDELAQQDLRAVEQKYNLVKLQFEERITDLENQLSLYQQAGGSSVIFKEHPHSHAVALERELNNVRDRCKKQVLEMQAEVDRVTAELNKVKKNQENMMRNESRQTEAEWKQQILNLQNELKDRHHDIEVLQRTIDRMRAKTSKKDNHSKMNTGAAERMPSKNKDYEPGAFADGDLSALLLENQQLKAKVDQLQLELDQQRVDLRRSLAETESVARQNREQLEHQIEVLRSSHQKELQRILAEQALHSSASRLAELQSKCDTQEVMIRHLQAQLKKALSEVEQLPQLRARESQLQKQIEDLQGKLREAKTVQAPEMRHFESLEEKLTDLVTRQRKRETELDLVVKQNQQTCRAEMEQEIEKWKHVVDAKNQQLQVFRAELDSILDVLRTLQRQGVTLPIATLYS